MDQPKYFLQNPDADHSQATAVETDIPSLTTFVGSYLNNHKLPTLNWEINNVTGNITLYFEGNTENIIDVVLWHGRSCGTTRRDFRMLTLDSPCLCGFPDGEYCFNLESIFVPEYGVQPLMMNDTYAVYKVDAPEYPSNHWVAFEIGIKYKVFDKNDNNNILNRNTNLRTLNADEAESWFLVENGTMVMTTQISIVQDKYPFPDCSGASCKGTLV